MGFPMEMIVVQPVEWGLYDHTKNLRGTFTLWKPYAIFAGYASWPGNRASMPYGRELAELCLLSWIFGRLTSETATPNRRMFAPPFINPEELLDKGGGQKKWFSYPDSNTWLAENRDRILPGTHLIEPIYSHRHHQYGVGIGTLPRLDYRVEHNRVLALSRYKYAKWRESADGEYSPMWHRPFVWMRSATVAGWIRELERGDHHRCQVELRKDREASAMVKALCAYYRALALADCRILFTFEGTSESPLHAVL